MIIETFCPMEMIYESARKTPNIVVPNGKTISYEEAPKGTLEGTCWLCGCTTKHGHPKTKIIKPSFTDSDFSKATWSDVVCEHCTWALSYRSLRNYSILATGKGLFHPSREELRGVLLIPPEPPFVLCIAESGQPWLHYKTKLNLKNDSFTVRFEHIDVLVRPPLFGMLLGPIEELYTVFTKAEIAECSYQSHRIQKFGLVEWEVLERKISEHRGGGLFNLALFVAQRFEIEDKEEKKEVEPDVLRLSDI